MNPLLTVQYNTGITLTIPNQLVYSFNTFFSKDKISGTNSLDVLNGTDFTPTTGLVLIGTLGNENAEKRTVNTVAASTISVTTSIDFAHTRGENITQIAYDQIVIETATSSTGSFSVLATIAFTWTALNTIYQHTAGTAATYYRIKFLNSVTSVASGYSNGGVGVASSTFDSTTVAAMIYSIRSSVGNATQTDDFFIQQLNDARKILNEEFGYGRVNEWRQQFEYPIQMLAGNNYVSLPSDIEINTTNRMLLNARYARQSVAANMPIRYVDKREWNTRSWQNRATFTNGTTLSGAVSLVLDTTGDFPTSGTVYIATELPTQSILTVTYTGNDLLTNTLTGVSGITRNLADNVQVSAYPVATFMYSYTVFDGKIWFDYTIPQSLQGKNLYIDYYKKIVDLQYTSDPIPEPFRDIYKNYLRFAIKRRRDDEIGADDEDYKRFLAAAANVLGNPWTGQQNLIIT